MAHSCRHCQKLRIAPPTAAEGENWVSVLTVNVGIVRSAALDGCAFFQWCLSQHPKTVAESAQKRLEEFQDAPLLRVLMGSESSSRPRCKFVTFQWESPAGEEFRIRSLYILTEEGDPASHDYPAKVMEKTLGSSANFDQARSWLDQCDSLHSGCATSTNRTMPLRVIELCWISDMPQPTLHLVIPIETVKYAALTYCWGDPQSIELAKLTSKTQEDWLNDIPFGQLPKTLQDAIITTAKLGMQFLWVDCLCILQDDDHEKAIEISKMPQIYRGAYVTISAARSSSSCNGFLHDITVPDHHANVFKFAYTCLDGTLGSILLFDGHDRRGDPINHRAWTLQEYILSRRVLIYGRYGLHWSCRNGELYDDEEAARTWLSSYVDTRLASLRDLPENNAEARRNWQRTVEVYTQRTLSVPTDRLLAISGIAEAYAAIFKDEYLAGIWHRQLPSALMWETPYENFPRGPYCAPSWSWASIDSSVDSNGNLILVDTNLKIVTYSIRLAEARSPFGAIVSGHIILKGLMRPLRWNSIVLSSREFPSESYLAYTMMDAIEEDFPNDGSKTTEVWCLQICPFDELTGNGHLGLILARNETATFRRLGTFGFDEYVLGREERNASGFAKLLTQQRDWSQSCSLEEIMLV